MGIEYEDDSSPGYGYQQQNYTTAQQNYMTHQPNYTMAQQNYNMAQQNGYDDNSYYASNGRRYISHVGLNQVIPSSYHQQQQYQMNNNRVVHPVAGYTQPPPAWGWGSTNLHQYSANRDSGYNVHQNSSGGYQSEWMYN